MGRRQAYRARFGEGVDEYQRTRPVAPDAVFDEIVRLAAWSPGSRVVEVGPGTGQATRQLACRGLRVVAVEIDPRLADRAARNLGSFPDVVVASTGFEEWDPDVSDFDGIFACNSFHWVDPEVRLARSAALLEPGGHLVVLSTPVVVPDRASRFWWDIQDDWVAAGSERVDPASKHPDLVADPVPALVESGLFEPPVVTRHGFEVVLTAADYAANLSTQSGVKELGAVAAEVFLDRVRRRIDKSLGGTVEVHHLAVTTVARRSEQPLPPGDR